ncbi:MAG: phosphodiester glycosidase family protein [Eubacteriales bacterium]|nr:phosphodiester glycosidase family protein [Eubacteriales bacterium]
MRKMNVQSRVIAAATVVLLLLSGVVPLSSARAESAEIQTGQVGTVTGDCTITMPEELAGKEYRITDGLVESYQNFEAGQSVQIDLPEGAQGLYLEWYNLTSGYTVTQTDQSGTTLSEDAAQPFVNAYYPLKDGAKSVTLSFSRDCSLSTLSVYGAGDLPSSVQRWNQPTTADLLVVASNSKTALDEFFGVIATYACNHDIPTALVVMSRNTRAAQQELLSALWYAGYDQYPFFGDFTSVNDSLYKMVKNEWGRKTTLSFVEDHIAQLTPKVLVTHMDDETAPDGAAQVTGEYTLRAAEDAGVHKIYLASASGGTTLDYNAPLNGCFGKTVLELAADAFTLCTTRHAFESALVPTSSFLLSESAVGDDSSANDLFEHIDTATLGAYVEPTPTPQPTPEPTAEPTAEPEATVEPISAAQEPQTSESTPQTTSLLTTLGASPLVIIGIIALGAILSLVLMLTYGLRKRRRRIRPRAVVISLIPLVLGLLVSGALTYLSKKQVAQASLESTPAPTAVVNITPEPSATPEPTEEPEAEPETLADSANDEYYRQAGEPEEVIVVDEENGHWEYRTDTLSIQINRVTSEYTNYGGRTYPLVYFVAHIRMRDVDSFRTVQSADNRNGAGALKPWIIARRNKAVLMITGDNLTESDTQYKSILIRDGKVFLDSAKSDIMAIYPDMTLHLFSPKETNARELLMDGVREAFSFGPTLIRDGVFTTEDIDHTARIANETNPRTGLGMIDPGHFVAIVVDGRQKEYSYGMRLTAFGELFVKEGCVEAYNLDGGVSACMLFMGEQLNHHGHNRVGTIEDTYQRRIPDGLVWGYSDTVPSEDDPIYHRGEG